jgi:hypothetical protein
MFPPISVFAFAAPAGCSILSCIDVISQAVCIAEAIDDENWQGIFKCAKKKEVSPRARDPQAGAPIPLSILGSPHSWHGSLPAPPDAPPSLSVYPILLGV